MRSMCLFLLVTISSFSQAETLWQDFSVTLLKGSNYEVGDNDRNVLTIEHAAGLSWGDSFFFMDRLESDNGDTETYAEFSPRIKFSSMKLGLVNNVYLASTAEIGDGFTNYLVGVGTDLNLPNFHYFKLNFYFRNNDGTDNGEQITASWGVPIAMFYFDGFIDFVPSTDDKKTTMNFTSQFKYDIAPLFGIKTKLYVGIEYVHWNNKYGINGIDERNVNALLKYHF